MNGRGASIPQNLLHDHLRAAPLRVVPGTKARYHVQVTVFAGQQDVAGIERKSLGIAARDTWRSATAEVESRWRGRLDG